MYAGKTAAPTRGPQLSRVGPVTGPQGERNGQNVRMPICNFPLVSLSRCPAAPSLNYFSDIVCVIGVSFIILTVVLSLSEARPCLFSSKIQCRCYLLQEDLPDCPHPSLPCPLLH